MKVRLRGRIDVILICEIVLDVLKIVVDLVIGEDLVVFGMMWVFKVNDGVVCFVLEVDLKCIVDMEVLSK